jgi:hypothetical protein
VAITATITGTATMPAVGTGTDSDLPPLQVHRDADAVRAAQTALFVSVSADLPTCKFPGVVRHEDSSINQEQDQVSASSLKDHGYARYT